MLTAVRNLLGLKEKSAVALTSNTTNGVIPTSWPMNWFQYGHKPLQNGTSSVVEACVAAYGQTIAQCPGKHYRREKNGAKTWLTDTSVQAVLNQPNDFQTRSDFLLNLVHGLLMDGNGYFFSFDDPTKAEEIFLLHPGSTRARRVIDTGDIFYETSGDWVEITGSDQNSMMIPSRYVGHIRMYTPQDPLIGVTPVRAASAAVAANSSIVNHQASFFNNMTRPSGVLSTDMELTKDQMIMLREAWEEQSKGLNAGGVPILGYGMKWDSMSLNAVDSQMIDSWKMTIEEISRVYRVPPMIINNLENSTFNNAEALMTFWLASGLGFMIDHIELVLAKFFRLPANEGIELDTDVLLRTDLTKRIAAYGVATQKGIYSINEARAKEGLPPAKGGEEPRVQAQMVPLSKVDEPEPPDTKPDEDAKQLELLPTMIRSRVRDLIVQGTHAC